MNRCRQIGVAAFTGFFALTAAALAEDGAVIKGNAVFKGDAAKFKRTVLDTSKDPNCKKHKARIGSYDVILNTKTDPVTVQNVMVYVDHEFNQKFPVPTAPAQLNQDGCEYTPHVLGIMEGQGLVVKNSDDTNHNIHFLPKKNEEHNFTQPKPGEKELKLVAEEPFKVKCDVHPWMGAYIGVFKHPFFSVTGADGTFEIKGLPPGKYKVVAWHESFGRQEAEIEVASGATAEKDFVFEPK